MRPDRECRLFAHRVARMVFAFGVMLAAASCSDQPSTAPVHTTPVGPATITLTVSDTTAFVGATVEVGVDVRQPETTQGSAMAAFRARLTFDPTALQYVDELPGDAGVHAVRVIGDTVRIAGAAPGSGFVDGRLVTLRFRVLGVQGLRGLGLLLDELRDLSYRDRRTEFFGRGNPGVRVTRPVADLVSSGSSSRVYGDATADGSVDAADVLAILTKDVGLAPPVGFDTLAADVNTDGAINALDAQIILASLVGRDVFQFRLGDVVGSARVSVTAMSPDTLRPGVTATITGVNFSATAANDTVMVDSIPLTVTAATATQLTVTLPATLPCRATHGALVTVRSGGATGAARRMLRVATPHALNVTDTLVFDSDSAFRCNEFPAGLYFVAVYNTAREAAATPDSFRLVSTSGTDVTGTPAYSNRLAPRVAFDRLGARVRTSFQWNRIPGGPRMRQRGLAHLRFMARDRERMERATGGVGRRAGGLRPRVLADRLRPMMNLVQTPGAYSMLNFPGATQAGTDTVITVRARTVYVGTRALILEDSLAPLAGTMDSYYQQLGSEFDNVMYPILTANFGNPLAMDGSLSGVGRVTILFTPLVETDYPGTEAFVTGCDFLSPTYCPASNLTEMMYGVVPTLATTPDGSDPNYDTRTPQGWYNWMRGTLVHEGKHITTLAEKLSRSATPVFEESWLEEGTAQIAAELYARRASGATWKGGMGFDPALRCEIYLCQGYGFTMYDHFGWLYDYEAGDDTLSPIDPGWADGTIYGSAWLLTRWAMDAYAGDEASFLKALVQTVTTNGVSNLEARTGVPWSQMLGRWVLALAGDHYPGISGYPPGFLSWNTRDVFSGLYSYQETPAPYPLYIPQYDASQLSVPGAVAAGSAAFFDLIFGAKQSIGIRAVGAGELPYGTTLRVAVVRMQ